MRLNIYEVADLLNQPSLSRQEVHTFLTSKLSPQQSKFYFMIKGLPNISTHEVSYYSGIGIHQTNNLLRQLMRLGLVERKKSGGVYRYGVVEV